MSSGVVAVKDDVADGLAAGRSETVQGRRSVEVHSVVCLSF